MHIILPVTSLSTADYLDKQSPYNISRKRDVFFNYLSTSVNFIAVAKVIWVTEAENNGINAENNIHITVGESFAVKS
jgi:hypothetical protein